MFVTLCVCMYVCVCVWYRMDFAGHILGFPSAWTVAHVRVTCPALNIAASWNSESK